MVHGAASVSIPNLSYIPSGGGKMSLPVDSSSLIYSHFEHVSGVIAGKGLEGVSISKLHLLDVLIGQFNQIKKTSTLPSNPFEGMDALIESYKTEIKKAKAAPYFPAPNGEPGALFNLLN